MEERLERPRKTTRLRRALEIAGFVTAIAGVGFAAGALVVAIHTDDASSRAVEQNAESLRDFKASLQKAEVDSSYLITSRLCVDSHAKDVGGIYGTTLTNNGRLPITVVHVGSPTDPPYVNDFEWVRVDDLQPTIHRGPFKLDVGESVAIRYNSKSLKATSAVLAQLSDGTTVTTRFLGGNGDVTADDAYNAAIEQNDLQCIEGTPFSAPLSAFLDPKSMQQYIRDHFDVGPVQR